MIAALKCWLGFHFRPPGLAASGHIWICARCQQLMLNKGKK